MTFIRQAAAVCVLLLTHSSGMAGNNGEITLNKVVQATGGHSLHAAQGYRLFATIGQAVVGDQKISGSMRLRIGFWSPLVPQGDALFADDFETIATRSLP